MIKRLLLSSVGVAALAVAGATAAGAATAPRPTAHLSAPTRVTGGGTFFVRSIDPCPAPGGRYEMIRVGIAPAGDPGSEPGYGSQAWVSNDGSWVVSLQAPAIPANQPTLPFTVEAECVISSTTPDGDEAILRTYFPQYLWSVSSGGTALSVDAEYAGATTTTTAAPTTTTTAAPTTTTSSTSTSTTSSSSTTSSTIAPGAFTGGSSGGGGKLSPSSVDDIRAELAAKGVDVSHMSDAEILQASPVAAHRLPDSGGLPWWTFVLLTMFAVGAVVAWGARKRVSAADLV